LSRTGAEAKPPWTAVPRAIKDEVAKLLGIPYAEAWFVSFVGVGDIVETDLTGAEGEIRGAK